MTTIAPPGPLTTRAVLASGGELDREIERALHEAGATRPLGGVVASLGASAQRQFGHDLVAAVAALSDVDIGDIVLTCWCKHRTLQRAAQRTLDVPGSRETVRLAAHRISHTAEPYVDVLLGDRRVARLSLSLSVVIDVTGVEASVADGCLVALHCGDATATVSLAVDDVPVARRSTRLDLPIDIALGTGVPLSAAVGPRRP